MQARNEIHQESKPKLPKCYLSGKKKALIVFGLLSFLVIGGAVIFLSRDTSTTVNIPNDQILARGGIHWHPRLEIYIDGKKQEIPANIGIGAVHQPIHTHEDNGTIHMEMTGEVAKEETRLGRFFEIWGKKFSPSQLFDKKNGEEGKVLMTVNGKENKEFANYHMKDGDIIEIRYE